MTFATKRTRPSLLHLLANYIGGGIHQTQTGPVSKIEITGVSCLMAPPNSTFSNVSSPCAVRVFQPSPHYRYRYSQGHFKGHSINIHQEVRHLCDAALSNVFLEPNLDIELALRSQAGHGHPRQHLSTALAKDLILRRYMSFNGSCSDTLFTLVRIQERNTLIVAVGSSFLALCTQIIEKVLMKGCAEAKDQPTVFVDKMAAGHCIRDAEVDGLVPESGEFGNEEGLGFVCDLTAGAEERYGKALASERCAHGGTIPVVGVEDVRVGCRRDLLVDHEAEFGREFEEAEGLGRHL
jgi:hypothetical protein